MSVKKKEAKDFLNALYPEDVPTGTFLLVWQRSKKTSHWFTSVESAAAQAVKIGTDVYVGCSLASQNWGPTQRGTADQTAGITALWCEVDWLDEKAHQKKLLPKTPEDALSLIKDMPITPSVIVRSGHGFHAWWLLKEPFLYRSAEERDRAANAVYGWHQVFKRAAAKRGWTVDSVFDLARVFRIPGTINAKGENPVAVSIEKLESKLRFDLDDFESFFNDTAPKKISKAARSVSGFDMNENAMPPLEKLEVLLTNDDRFRSTWNRTRKDAVGWSQSEYDLSLAVSAVIAEWTDQEIVNLLIYNRKKHGAPKKLRLEYLEGTISKARSVIKKDEAMERIEAIANDSQPIETISKRREALEQLGNVFGFKVDRITKEIADEPHYSIETELGAIDLGTINSIMSQTQFRNRIAAATGKVISKRSSGWDSIAQVILNACEEVSIGAEATKSGAAMSWLRGYCEETRASENIEEAIKMRKPFVDAEGRLNIFLAPLRSWIRTSPEAGDNMSAKAVGQHLRSIGGEPRVVPFKNSTRGVWVFQGDVTEYVTANAYKTEPRNKDDEREMYQ